MIKVLFVCHGNICRSPMAEFVFKDMITKQGFSDQFIIASAATSTEEIGNPVHRGTKYKLLEHGISCAGKTAVQMKKEDYNKYDYLLAMDTNNLRNMERIVGHRGEKMHLLLEYAGEYASIADPWYTGDFEATYQDVVRGCEGFLQYLYQNNLVESLRK